MKKINGGFGKEIEVSDDIADIVDPESLLSEHIPEIKQDNNNKIHSDITPEDHVIVISHFLSKETELSITGLLKKIIISNDKLEYEFFMLKKNLFSFLRMGEMKLYEVKFVSNGEEHKLDSEIRLVRKIEFESFDKQVKCHVFA